MGYVEDKLAGLAATVALEAERTREAFAAGLQETREGLRITGARYVPLRPAGQVTPVAGRLAGWSLLAAGGAATITLHDGQTPDDAVLAVLTLTDGAAQTITLPAPGVSFVHGLFAEMAADPAAVITGALWLGALD